MKQLTVITGNSKKASAVALNQMLKKNNGRWIVLDYTGRLSLVFQGIISTSLDPATVSWVDLANRSIPIGLFRLKYSKYLELALFTCLQNLRILSGFSVSDTTLKWIAEANVELSKQGSITLVSLLKNITTQEMRSWFFDLYQDIQQLETAGKMLAWCLDFPSVYALSEGFVIKNQRSLLRGKSRIFWIEMLSEHFEFLEHRIISALLSCIIELYVRQLMETYPNEHFHILHGFPPSNSSKGVGSWIEETCDRIHHVCVLKIYPDQNPQPHVLDWVQHATTLWVTPFIKNLSGKTHKIWLSEQEINLIDELKEGQIFIKDTSQNKALIVKIPDCGHLPSSHLLRQASLPRGEGFRPCRLRGSNEFSLSFSKPLYDQLCRVENLKMAWMKVRQANKSSKGIDGITIESFEKNAENQIVALATELRTRAYRPRPLKRVYLPKADGSNRAISINCVRDRVVQAACLAIIEPFYELDFSNFSFAFRPGRNAHQALELASGYISRGYKWVIKSDIKKCFDTIDQQLLLEMLEEKISDKEILGLISNWLNIDVIEMMDVLPIMSGVPQGAVLSPFLANVYLDPLDKFFEKSRYPFIRYADDILAFAYKEDEAITILTSMEKYLHDNLRLALKPSKTHCVGVEEGFNFLGFAFQGITMKICEKKKGKIIYSLTEQIKLLGRHRSLEGIFENMLKLNSMIRGVRNYFTTSLDNKINDQFKEFDSVIEELGTRYLPEEIRKESIWQMREHFFLPRYILEDMKKGITRQVRLVGSGYPLESLPTSPNVIDIKKKDRILQQTEDVLTQEQDNESPVVTEDNQVYILHHGCLLTCDSEFIILKKFKKEIWRRRFTDTSAILFQGKGNSVTTSLHMELSNHNIHLFFITMCGDVATIAGTPVNSDKTSLRLQQALRHDDPKIINAGLTILAAKIGNQSALLKYFSKYRKKTEPEIGAQLWKASQEIDKYSDLTRKLSPTTPMIRKIAMGFEGKAAAVYWQNIASILPTSFDFTHRVTRGAEDIINQCLNYAYALLYGEVWKSVFVSGLDPCFGLMHSSQRDQGSLIFDLIEEFRVPFCDRLIFSLLGRGFIPRTGKDGYLLIKTRKTILSGFLKRWGKIMKWRSQNITPMNILRLQVGAIVALFQKNECYKPFRMKW